MHHLQRNLRIGKAKDNLRDNGLCFRCKEKFTPEHRCKLATFSLLEMSNDNEQLVDREVEANENEYEEGINQQDMAEISFHAILSKTSGTTMKVEGTLEGRKVLTLVDSGSTHNFISTSLVKQLELKVSTVPSFGVQIGNGQIIQCNQICRGLSLVLPVLKITEDFFPFSMRGADLVLGIKWIASLNTVQANWNEMFMIFYVNGKKYKLQGVPSVAKTDVSLQSYSKLPDATSYSSRPRVEIPAYMERKIKELMLFQGGHNILIF
ncbi:retrotransposon gag domain, retroviral aspartyl protease [Tanacetum coccineum]|uniref:Retrotransposon gag domain, retroviral aspartyl protease n=1 Tax=Tanacetum coccineum TaxID=301880 RepID=A0ABQ5FJ47_9ASTR